MTTRGESKDSILLADRGTVTE